MKPVLLGIDVGTTGCKTALYREDGVELAQSYREYKLHHPQNNLAEQDPEDWWRAVVETTRDVLSQSGVKAECVVAAGVSCTNGLVVVDQQGEPLLPAIMMLDQRSVPQAAWMAKNVGEDSVFAITGNRIAPGAFSAPIMKWVAEERPDIYLRTHKFLVPTGFIVQRLTGEFTIDASRASSTMVFDIRQRKWSGILCRAFAIDEEKLPQLYESAEIVGTITAKAAELTGLRQGMPIIAGCVDTASAAIGAGAIEPGQTFGMLGTVGRVSVVTDGARFDRRMMNFCHGLPDRWLTVAAINGAGSSLRWFRDTFYQMEAASFQKRGLSPYDAMMSEAIDTCPGADGLIYLPYLLGERTPIWSVDAKGVLYGMTLGHKRGHIIRALMEGVAYAIRHNLEIIRDEYNVSFQKMTLGGGGAKGRLWTQIVSDVTQTDILIPEVLETEVLGTALLAGTAVGMYPDLTQAVARAVRMVEQVPCNTNNAETYDQHYRAYRTLVDDMLPRFADFAHLTRK